MKSLFVIFGLIAFPQVIQAQGTCAATVIGYEALCSAQTSEPSCNFHSQCQWANSGFEACSAYEVSYEAFCSVQPSKAACEASNRCFWACQTPGTCS